MEKKSLQGMSIKSLLWGESILKLPSNYYYWGSSMNFFLAKSAGRCFTPVMEIKPNRVSLRWNFYADIQLIRGRFWLQLWTVKEFIEPRVSWKFLAKVWKKIRNDFGICSGVSTMSRRRLLALRSIAPPAAGRLQAEQTVKRTYCWAWLTVIPMAERL